MYRKYAQKETICFKGLDFGTVSVSVETNFSPKPPTPIPKSRERSPNPSGEYYLRPELADEELFAAHLVRLHKEYQGAKTPEKYIFSQARHLATTQALSREYADRVAEKALRELEFGKYKKRLISKVRKALDKEEEQ